MSGSNAMLHRLANAIDRVIGTIVAVGALLAPPLSLLLFLQWPLREIVHAGAREANDLAQILFALYVSIGITAATRQNAHVAVDLIARRYRPRLRGALSNVAALVAIVPWASFVLYSAGPGMLQSVRELERFPDTYNPGYFLLRLALALLAVLALAQAVKSLLTFEAPPG